MAASTDMSPAWRTWRSEKSCLDVVGHGLYGVGVVDAGLELDRDEQCGVVLVPQRVGDARDSVGRSLAPVITAVAAFRRGWVEASAGAGRDDDVLGVRLVGARLRDHRGRAAGLAGAVVGVIGFVLGIATARPTAMTTKTTQARIALQGWSALHRAAFIGTAVSGLPMAVSLGIGGYFQASDHGRSRQGRRDPHGVVPAPLRGVGAAGEDGSVSTPVRPGTPGRLLLTGYAVAQFLLSIPLLVLLVLWIVGGVLVIVWIGLGFLAAALPATRWIANLHRAMAARVIGAPVPVPYRPLPPDGFFTKLRAVAADPMTWRDLAWVLVAPIAALTVSLLVVILLLGVVTGFIWWFATRH